MKLKFKNILLISLLAVAGIFSATAVAFTKQINEQPVAEKAEAATGWYIAGSGSFVTGDEWTTSGGVQLDASEGNKGALLNFYLEEGDIFKITDGTNWYGSNNSATGSDWTNFQRTSYIDKNKTKATLYFNHSACSWWANASSKTRVNLWGGAAGHGLTNKDLSGPSGYIDIYTDNTTIKFERTAYSGNNTGNQSIPSDWSTQNTFKLNSAGNGGSWGYTENISAGANIRVKTSGFYNIYFNNSSQIYIAGVSELYPGDAVYLNLNGQWSGKTPKAHIWNSNHTGEAVDLTMTEVHGHGGSSKLFEVKVPTLVSANPNYIIFYHDSWNDQTPDLQVVHYSNTFKLTSSNNGSWDTYITNNIRASYFGIYFNTCVVCNNAGYISTDKWGNAKTEYNNMCDNAQGVVWDSDTNPSGTDLQKAMSKYDYIIYKYPEKMADDFINRHTNSHYPYGMARQGFPSIFNLVNNESSFSTIIIVISSSVALLSVTALSILVIRKRKSKEQ